MSFLAGIWVRIGKWPGGNVLRALSSALSNVPNAKYLAHLTHQSQKSSLISSSKSQKI